MTVPAERKAMQMKTYRKDTNEEDIYSVHCDL